VDDGDVRKVGKKKKKNPTAPRPNLTPIEAIREGRERLREKGSNRLQKRGEEVAHVSLLLFPLQKNKLHHNCALLAKKC